MYIFRDKFFITTELEQMAKIVMYKVNEETVRKTTYSYSLAKATVILEDKRFHTHVGFDYKAIVRSLFYNLYKSQKSGASTIEQQLVRTITGKKERTLKRKIKEIYVAYKVSKTFTKKEIINAYLHLAYFGTDTIGCSAISSKLLNKKIEDLTIYESFLIASCLKYPVPRISNENWRKKVEHRTKYGLKRYRFIKKK